MCRSGFDTNTTRLRAYMENLSSVGSATGRFEFRFCIPPAVRMSGPGTLSACATLMHCKLPVVLHMRLMPQTGCVCLAHASWLGRYINIVVSGGAPLHHNTQPPPECPAFRVFNVCSLLTRSCTWPVNSYHPIQMSGGQPAMLGGNSVSRDLWFDDGNTVFIAQSAAFRVHKSVLSHHSDVFRGLFAVSQPPVHGTPSDMFEGVPSLHVSDTSYDFRMLMSALYGGTKCDTSLLSGSAVLIHRVTVLTSNFPSSPL